MKNDFNLGNLTSISYYAMQIAEISRSIWDEVAKGFVGRQYQVMPGPPAFMGLSYKYEGN